MKEGIVYPRKIDTDLYIGVDVAKGKDRSVTQVICLKRKRLKSKYRKVFILPNIK